MNQLSLETLKALIEINGDINSDYQHKDALFFRILKAAMRLVCCEMVCYITVENGVILKLVSKIKKDKETVANTDIVKSGIFDIVLRGESLYANDANEDLYYSQFLTQFDDDIDSFETSSESCKSTTLFINSIIPSKYSKYVLDIKFISNTSTLLNGNFLFFIEL